MTRRSSQRRRGINNAALDEALSLVVGALGRKPAANLPRRLDNLFKELGTSNPPREPDELIELIWALWIAHPDREASSTMVAAVEAISAGARDLARPILDRLVEEYPDWAEAWNKRATLAFLERRDEDCIADITRTLALEPRHFGAMLGFGQICLRHNRPREAKAAFEIALSLNPHLHGLSDIVSHLDMPRERLH